MAQHQDGAGAASTPQTRLSQGRSAPRRLCHRGLPVSAATWRRMRRQAPTIHIMPVTHPSIEIGKAREFHISSGHELDTTGSSGRSSLDQTLVGAAAARGIGGGTLWECSCCSCVAATVAADVHEPSNSFNLSERGRGPALQLGILTTKDNDYSGRRYNIRASGKWREFLASPPCSCGKSYFLII